MRDVSVRLPVWPGEGWLKGSAERGRRSEGMVIELLRKRASVRRFQDRPIPDEVVREILEAGRLSPGGRTEIYPLLPAGGDVRSQVPLPRREGLGEGE